MTETKEPTPGLWEPYFTVHGDPMVVPSSAPYPTSRICDVSTAPGDYGRANAVLLASAPMLLVEIEYLRMALTTARDFLAYNPASRHLAEQFPLVVEVIENALHFERSSNE